MAKAKEADVPKSAALEEIETLADVYADEAMRLREIVAACEVAVREVQAKHTAEIRTQAETTAAAREALIEAVDSNRALFSKPKSRVLYGVKVGLKKAQDSLTFDAEAVIRRIRSLFPAKAETLLRRKVEINRDALKALTGEELQKLGVKRVAGADEPFATIEDSDPEKAAAAILDAAGGER